MDIDIDVVIDRDIERDIDRDINIVSDQTHIITICWC